MRALQQHVSLEFNDTSVKEICQFATQQHNVPFTLGTDDLKAAGADPDLRVSITASGLTLAQALTTMLEKVKEPPLDYYIDGGTVHISTVAAMKTKDRLVYYRLACLSPEGQAAAEKYITPLAISVAPLEGDLLVDASVYTHKKFEEYLQGAWRLESQRPARAIPLGLSAQSPLMRKAPVPEPQTEQPDQPLPNPPATVPASKLTVDPLLDQIGLQLLIFEAGEEVIAKVTTKANPKSATRELVEGFEEKSNDFLREHQAKILSRPTMYTLMGQPGQIQVGHVVPVTGDEHATELLTSLPAGVTVQLTPRKRTREGGLLLEYQIEISTRDEASEVDVEGTSVPTVSGRTLRGFATLPAGHQVGILLGPIWTTDKTNKGYPPEKPPTYIWVREQAIEPAQQQQKATDDVQATPAIPLPEPNSPELPVGLKPDQNAPEAISGEDKVTLQKEEVFVSLILFEVDEAGFRELADEDRTEATLKLTPKPDFSKLLRTLTRENRARLAVEQTICSPMGKLGKFKSGGDFPVPAAKTDGDEPARQQFGIMTEMTPVKRESDGRLVLKYDLEFSNRDFNNPLQTEGLVVPNVVAKVFRGFSILPVKGTEGILIGPVATVSRSENDQPARNVSTYLWMREEVDNPIPRLPDPSKRP